MKLGEIVAKLRTANNWGTPELARRATACGDKKVSYQTIQQLEEKPDTSPRSLPQLAGAFGKTVEELLAWRPGMPPFGPNTGKPAPIAAYEVREVDDGVAETDDDVLIDEVDVVLSGGHGKEVPDFVPTKRKLAFSTSWLRKKRLKADDLKVMAVAGDSMWPTLADRDTVLIDTSNTRTVDGKIYAFIANGTRIKRLRWRADGVLIVISDNPNKTLYPDETINLAAGEQCFLLGRAVQRSGDL